MQRNTIYSNATILRVRASGEANREVTFLSDTGGLVIATHYGGPKSKLRSHISAFNSGVMYVYHDPVRGTNKISDFDVRIWRFLLREVYERSAAANAIAETVLFSKGSGGDWAAANILVDTVLDELEKTSASAVRPLFVYFLWRWSECLGVQPSLTVCAECECSFADGISAWYRSGELLCDNCKKESASDHFLEVSAGVRKWLKVIARRGADFSSHLSTTVETQNRAYQFCKAILQPTFGKYLNTWEDV